MEIEAQMEQLEKDDNNPVVLLELLDDLEDRLQSILTDQVRCQCFGSTRGFYNGAHVHASLADKVTHVREAIGMCTRGDCLLVSRTIRISCM